MKAVSFAVVVLLASWPLAARETPDGEAALDAWLGAQAEVAAWSADVTQTRSLRSLARPLETAGRVWLERPNRFRWQLGDPPRTIAVRSGGELRIVYPRLRRVELYAATGEVDGAWNEALALLDVGFPSDPESFRARYGLEAAELSEGVWRFELRPAAAGARRLIDGVVLEVSAADWRLLATELAFPDGSTMRNAFSGHDFDPEITDGLFTVEIEEGWEVSEPLAERSGG